MSPLRLTAFTHQICSDWLWSHCAAFSLSVWMDKSLHHTYLGHSLRISVAHRHSFKKHKHNNIQCKSFIESILHKCTQIFFFFFLHLLRWLAIITSHLHFYFAPICLKVTILFAWTHGMEDVLKITILCIYSICNLDENIYIYVYKYKQNWFLCWLIRKTKHCCFETGVSDFAHILNLQLEWKHTYGSEWEHLYKNKQNWFQC